MPPHPSLTKTTDRFVEARLESNCVAVALADGWSAFKLKHPGRRGAPDHVFLRNGMALLVEFKRPKTSMQRAGVASALQVLEFKKLAENRNFVHIIDRLEDFEALLKRTLEP